MFWLQPPNPNPNPNPCQWNAGYRVKGLSNYTSLKGTALLNLGECSINPLVNYVMSYLCTQRTSLV